MFIQKKLARAVLTSAVLLGSATSAFAYNHVINGDFQWEENGYDNWKVWVDPNEAEATFKIGGSHQEGRVRIADGGKFPWDIQLYQANLQLEQGKTYRVQFDYTESSKSADGKIKLTIEKNGGDDGNTYTQYMNAQHVIANPSYQHFDHTFTMSNTSDWNARIAFNYGTNVSHFYDGGPKASIFIDNVSVEEVYDAPLEMIKNGNFSEGGQHWNTWIHPDYEATSSINFEDNSITIEYTDTGDKWFKTQITSEPLTLIAGQTYRLEFGYASGSKTTGARGAVVVESADEPYTKYLRRQNFYPVAVGQKAVYEFVPEQTVYNARIAFNMGKSVEPRVGSIMIDNVSLKAVD